MENVIKQAQRLKRVNSNKSVEWGELSLALTELADAVADPRVTDYTQAIQEHLVPLADDFSKLLRSIRSKLVFDTCEQLGRIVKTTRAAFTPLANSLLAALADTAKGSSIAIRDPGFRLFSDVSEYSRYDIQLLQKVYRNAPQESKRLTNKLYQITERVRVLIQEQLQIVLTYWSKGEMEPYYTEMVEVMHRGLRDPSVNVRTSCRQTFCSFSDLWLERLDELVDLPTPPARDLLMKEKPHATITKAIRQKYANGATKDNTQEEIRGLRRDYRRQGSTAGGDGDDGVFIDVRESPGRPTRRPAETETAKRGVSPGRGAIRGASPSRTARGVSPTATTRSSSPGASTRNASEAAQATRANSPGRSAIRSTSPRINGRATASSPPSAPLRTGEYERYLSVTAAATISDRMGVTTGGVVPVKRVSIVEPVASHTAQHTQANASDDGDDYPVYSLNPAAYQSPPTSRFTVHETRSSRDALSFDQDNEGSPDSPMLSSLDVPQFVVNHPIATGETRGTPVTFSSFQYSSEAMQDADSFLDHPIPSSVSAPTPRASANVTMRDRPRGRNQELVGHVPEEDEANFPSIAPHVTAAHVPDAIENRQPLTELPTVSPPFAHPRIVEEPTPPPPRVSIASMMYFPEPSVDELMDQFEAENLLHQPGDENTNKENIAVRQPQILSPQSADALAKLNAARAGLKEVREQSEFGNLGLQVKKMGHPRSGQEQVAVDQKPRVTQPFAPLAQNRGLDAIVSATAVEQEPAPTPSAARPRDDTSPSVQETQSASPLKVDFLAPSVQRVHSPPSRTHQEPRPRVTTTSEREMERKPSPDFVRAAPQVRFAPPQQLSSATRPHQMHEPVSRQSNRRDDAMRTGTKSKHEILREESTARDASANDGGQHERKDDTRVRPEPIRTTNSPDVHTEQPTPRRHPVLSPKPQRVDSGIVSKMVFYFCLVLATLFAVYGLIRGATTVRDANAYHQAMLGRIHQFESSIVESHDSLRKMDEKCAMWSEHVRELTEQDELNALHQLESIQQEVDKWQIEMKNDLLEFKRSLSGDIIDAALAPLREANNTTTDAADSTEPTT